MKLSNRQIGLLAECIRTTGFAIEEDLEDMMDFLEKLSLEIRFEDDGDGWAIDQMVDKAMFEIGQQQFAMYLEKEDAARREQEAEYEIEEEVEDDV